MRREWQEHFPAADSKRNRLLAIPACITARASCKCRDACRGRLTRDNGENVPGIPGAYATRSFTYLARGPWRSWYWSLVNWQTHIGNHWLISAMTMISDPIIFVVVVLTISFVIGKIPNYNRQLNSGWKICPTFYPVTVKHLETYELCFFNVCKWLCNDNFHLHSQDVL